MFLLQIFKVNLQGYFTHHFLTEFQLGYSIPFGRKIQKFSWQISKFVRQTNFWQVNSKIFPEYCVSNGLVRLLKFEAKISKNVRNNSTVQELACQLLCRLNTVTKNNKIVSFSWLSEPGESGKTWDFLISLVISVLWWLVDWLHDMSVRAFVGNVELEFSWGVYTHCCILSIVQLFYEC